MLSLIVLSFVGFAAAGVLALFGGQRLLINRLVQIIFFLSAAAGLVASAFLLLRMLSGAAIPLAFTLPGLPVPFFMDALAAFFLLLINLGMCLTSLFAMGYLPKYADSYSFPALNAATAAFVLGMQFTVLAANTLGFLMCWEVMSVAAYFLVIADHEPASIKAGFTYFVMTHLGFACLLAGFLLLAHGDATALLSSFSVDGLSSARAGLVFILILLGFGSKAGLVPLHQWLPQAHPQAPSHSSALMSGVMLKMAVYGFLRIVLVAFPVLPLALAASVVAIGLLSAGYGVLAAAVESDLKRLLAWSSIENLGLIFAMLGTGLAMRSQGLDGRLFFVAAVLHALNHTVFKSGLFMAAGAIISATHTRDLDELGGLAKIWPGFSAAVLGLVFAAAALPPFGTFYGEWLYVQSLAAQMLAMPARTGIFMCGIVISVVALVGGLAMFTFVKTFSAVFLGRARSDHAEQARPLDRLLAWPVGLAALLSLAFGVGATSLAAHLGGLFQAPLAGSVAGLMVSGSAMIRPTLVALAAVLSILMAMLVRWVAMNGRPVRLTDTWDCGQPLTRRMTYTASGFAAPIRFFFRDVLLARKTLSAEALVPGNPWIAQRRLEWQMESIWERWFYRPLIKAVFALAAWLKKLQNGVIQFYILLILATLIALLVFAV